MTTSTRQPGTPWGAEVAAVALTPGVRTALCKMTAYASAQAA